MKITLELVLTWAVILNIITILAILYCGRRLKELCDILRSHGEKPHQPGRYSR